MKMRQTLTRQRGGLLLLVVVVTGVTALTGALATRVIIQNQQATNQVYDDIAAGRPVSDERLESARLNTYNNLRVANGAANIIVSIDPSPDAGSVVSSYAGGVISNQVDQASNPDRPTRSNPLPADVPEPAPSCDSANHGLCTTYASCARAGGYWHNGACYSTPQTSCDSSHLSLCLSTADCTSAGGYWYNGSCNSSPQSICDSGNLSLCATSAECQAAGGYWYDLKCNASPSACYLDVTQCANATDCSNALGYWYNNQCHVNAQLCTAENVSECPDSSSCEQAGGYWYSNSCFSSPDQYVCNDGSTILRALVCNGVQNCPGGDDEANCGTESSCCVATNGCPSETATSCAETCCCCPYGYICDQQNPANGCVPSS